MTTIIIGATGGIGSALCRRLATARHTIHAIGRDPAKLGALIAETGGTHAVADVTDRAQLEAAIKAAGPTVSGLAYCVGSINLKPVSRITDEDVERDFRLNALGALHAVQFALPALKASGNASVVLFSTVAVAQGFASHASIGMAKGAVEGLMLSLAAELAPKIRVNCVAPSLTKTPLAAALTGNEQMATAIAALHPLQRLGEADDVAAAAAFLLSPDASWITGQAINVDGGRSSLRTKG
ncbi:MAG: SDR family oxidoreductase [Aestuariivirga sp.]|uniref:SDR family NAD(P)-dependent oxidoreductase n=1 Tax=Aestuariivirga sp. TaxID=2650926 RepID=UPI0025C4B676|nr:SDR family oxidoreductase [Aestuariivirga sp.]MCA3560490.1 SDR family oxidoreductase [Aestuariivirga sp.]